MNPNLLVYLLVALRGSAMGLSIGGRPKTAEAFYNIADAIESGRATDEHLRTIAEKLKNRHSTEDDWVTWSAQLDKDIERLHGPITGAPQ